jgi:NADPH2:quinone reductase
MAAGVAQLDVWFRQGRLKPWIDRTLPLDRAAEALNLMASRAAKGKIVLTL